MKFEAKNKTMTKIPKVGEQISRNFKATEQIASLDQLYKTIRENKSIYARNRIYPAAFFLNWPIKLCHEWLTAGWFWKIERL